jgi:hypothetical protein
MLVSAALRHIRGSTKSPSRSTTEYLDAKTVVFEVAEAIGLTVDELHFVVEALGDPDVASEAPHGYDSLRSGGEGLAKLGQAGVAQLVNNTREARYHRHCNLSRPLRRKLSLFVENMTARLSLRQFHH